VPGPVPLERDPFDLVMVEGVLLALGRIVEDASVYEAGDAELVDAKDLGGLGAADPRPGHVGRVNSYLRMIREDDPQTAG
jgi:hypothetical protein